MSGPLDKDEARLRRKALSRWEGEGGSFYVAEPTDAALDESDVGGPAEVQAGEVRRLAAAAGGDWEAAEDHFALALKDARAMPHVVEEAHTLRLHGAMLLKTGSKTERARARELLAEAAYSYDSFGMPRFRDLCRDP